MKVAALDLGTNTFLCLIAEVDEAGVNKVIADLHRVVRLGQGVDKSKSFHPEALIRAKECLADFKKEIDKHKVKSVLAMATSAARDVTNGHELFEICRGLNIPLEIISGDDEARLTFSGATAGGNYSGNTLIVDVGGGSTEFIIGNSKEILFEKSLDIGAVRLTERFIKHQPTPQDELSVMIGYVDQQIALVQKNISKFKIDSIVATAGTPTSLAAIEMGGFSDEKVHGFVLTKENLEVKMRIFQNQSVQEKADKYSLGGRADIILAGTSILYRTLVNLNFNHYVVSTRGVRYGVAQELYQRSLCG